MILGFKHFHPLRGILPSTFPEFGGNIVFRARTLLRKRAEEEIFAAIEIINWMIDQSPARKEALAQLKKGVADADGINETVKRDRDNSVVKRDLDSSSYALKACQLKYDITGDHKFPNASWAELFAVLALSLVDQACKDELLHGNNSLSRNPDVDREWFQEYRTVSHASYSLIEAMDAVGTAEGVSYLESGITEKQKMSIRAMYAAKQRHKPTDDALAALMDFYIPEKHKSMRNAAKLFCETFPEKVAHLAYDNRVRTLSGGLSRLLKGQPRSSQQ